jgi:tRNA(Ile)-lysidine synthase TilS/MesJ
MIEENLNLASKMNIMSIAGCDIGIYNDGPVGVLVSGGADSAVLLYIIMQYVNKPIHIYSKINAGILAEQGPALDNVVEICSSITGNKNYVVHKIVPEATDHLNYFTMCNAALDSGEVDILYAGLTSFPENEVWADWPLTSNFQENLEARAPGITHSLWGIENFGSDPARSVDNRYYKPWVNKTKKDIAAMYRELNIEADLYPKSRSCESETTLVKHCGDCWWCKERIWAFGYLE